MNLGKEKNIVANGHLELGNPTTAERDGGKPVSQDEACGLYWMTLPRAFAEEACHGDRLESHHRSGPRQEDRRALLRPDLRLEMRARRLLRTGAGERADDAAVRRRGGVPKSSLRLSRQL